MYSYLGWFFVFILALMILPYIIRLIMKQSAAAKKNKTLKKMLKISRKMHQYIIFTVIFLAPVHAYLALGGSLRLHTGSLLYLSILITSILGYVFYKRKKKSLIKFHKFFVIIVLIFLFIHLVYPNLLWTLSQ